MHSILRITVVVVGSISFHLSFAAEGPNKGKTGQQKIQNSYIVNPANPFLPVQLNSSKSSDQVQMIRDFGETGESEALPHPGRISDDRVRSKIKIDGNPQLPLTYIPAKINLGEIAFEGRVIEPRIKFAASQLEQRQSHDVANDSYISKIYSILEKSDY